MIASLFLAAAETALQMAADSLTKEVQEMSQKYLDDCKKYNDFKVELDLIEISREKVSQHKREFEQLTGILQNTESNKSHNLDQWKAISIWMGHLRDTVAITEEVITKGLGDYTDMDLKNLQDAWENIKTAVNTII